MLKHIINTCYEGSAFQKGGGENRQNKGSKVCNLTETEKDDFSATK